MRQESNETWIFRGTVDLNNATEQRLDGSLAQSKLAQVPLSEEAIPLTDLRVWDDYDTILPGAAATDDLGLIVGTWGTDAPTVQTSDFKAAGASVQYAFFKAKITKEYDLGETLQLRVRAGMITTISDTTATVDLEVYNPDHDGAVGADLCATAAQTINTLDSNNCDFTITAGGIAVGDELLCRVAININDGATGTAVIGEIRRIARLMDSK